LGYYGDHRRVSHFTCSLIDNAKIDVFSCKIGRDIETKANSPDELSSSLLFLATVI
jgi:hypothetical protein